MTEMTPIPYRVTYSRRNIGGYYVHLDGEKVGWVVKREHGEDAGTWAFYACVKESTIGEHLATDHQRNTTVEEGLSQIRIRHLGRILRLDLDRDSATYLKDVTVYLDEERLKATWEDLTDKRYGLGAHA